MWASPAAAAQQSRLEVADTGRPASPILLLFNSLSFPKGIFASLQNPCPVPGCSFTHWKKIEPFCIHMQEYLFFPSFFTFSLQKAHFLQTPSLFSHMIFQSLVYVMKRALSFRVCPPLEY